MTITIIHQAPIAAELTLRYTQENVTLHVTPPSTLIQNPGTLYISDESLYFYSTVSNSGFAIPYHSIIIHAIARESHVGPSIYCQLEGSLVGAHPSNGSTTANGEDEDEEEAVLEMSFSPADVASLDTIYENLSYCASLHQDEDADNMDDDDHDMYLDDEDDHEGLYADADIQGGYILKSNSATAIGNQPRQDDDLEQVPAIDLQSGDWYTGNPETDAKFELSEQGQAVLARMENIVQDPQGLAEKNSQREEDGADEEEDRFKSADA